MKLRPFLRTLKLLLLGILCLFVFTREWPPFGDEFYRITQIVGQRQFDFLSWELSSIAAKAEAVLANNDAFLDDASRKQVVLDYMGLIQQVQQVEREIDQIYTDPTVLDPDEATAVLQSIRTQMHAPSLLFSSHWLKPSCKTKSAQYW